MAAAAADQHELYVPTHVFKRGEEIVRAVSLCSVALAMPDGIIAPLDNGVVEIVAFAGEPTTLRIVRTS